MEHGLLINATQGTVIRLLPALNISDEQVDEGVRDPRSTPSGARPLESKA